MADYKLLAVKMSPRLHTRAKVAAIKAGWELSALVRRLLALWLAGKVDVGPPRKRPKKLGKRKSRAASG